MDLRCSPSRELHLRDSVGLAPSPLRLGRESLPFGRRWGCIRLRRSLPRRQAAQSKLMRAEQAVTRARERSGPEPRGGRGASLHRAKVRQIGGAPRSDRPDRWTGVQWRRIRGQRSPYRRARRWLVVVALLVLGAGSREGSAGRSTGRSVDRWSGAVVCTVILLVGFGRAERDRG